MKFSSHWMVDNFRFRFRSSTSKQFQLRTLHVVKKLNLSQLVKSHKYFNTSRQGSNGLNTP